MGAVASLASTESLEFLRLGLYAIAYNVHGRARALREQIVPALADGTDEPALADLDDFNFVDAGRKGDGLWQSDRLTAVAGEDDGSGH
jgi:hypothetical protein